jgi:hypothetical protein
MKIVDIVKLVWLCESLYSTGSHQIQSNI